MILKTKEFQKTCKTILLAASNQAANIELKTIDNYLYLNVTNNEYYVSTKFAVDSAEAFCATVDANLFLGLVAGLTSDTFELAVTNNKVVIKSNKSKYTAPIIYDNDKVLAITEIKPNNITVEMPISKSILQSILTVNSRELVKEKVVEVTELQKLYYIDETGCFTFTSGACLNSFTLEKPVKMLLNDRIVKLFKLFDSDVQFCMGHDVLANGTIQTKISFATDDVYVGAIITNDDILINKVQGPCTATKTFINDKYQNSLVLSANTLNAAISRLMLFTKNSVEKTNMLLIPATISFNNNELTITDKLENSEVVTIENGSYVDSDYSMILNLADLKLVLDYCKDEHITLNCGNHRSVVVTRGNISNLIPEGVRA